MCNERIYSGGNAPFAPVAPSNIVASGASMTNMLLRWDAISSSSGYKIYRSTSLSEPFKLVANVNSLSSYLDLDLASGTTYYYKISSTEDGIDSALAGPVSASTYALMEPTNLKATALDASRILITWSSAAGAEGYRVYRNTSREGIYSLVGIVNVPEHTDTGLSPNTTYYYKVEAYSGSETGTAAGPVSATTFPLPPPDPPANIDATAQSETEILVQWSSVAGVDGYKIYRSLEEDGVYTLISQTFQTMIVDQWLTPGTTYFYKVASYIDSQNSSQTGPANATTWSLLAPLNVKAEALSQNEIEVTWDRINGTDGYILYRSLSENGPYREIGSTQDTSFVDTGLAPATTYFYKVAIYLGNFVGPQSDFADATTFSPTPTPHAPDNLHAEALSSSSILVSWDAIEGADGYYVYRSLYEAGGYTFISGVTDIRYIDEGLSPDTTYYYKVVSYIGAMISPEAGPVNATTFPDDVVVPEAPTCIMAKAVGCSCIEICWSIVEVAEGYNVYRSKNPCGPFTFLTTTAETKIRDNDLCPSTTYYYNVEAFQGNYIGDRSGTICATTFAPETSWEIYAAIIVSVLLISWYIAK